MYRFPTLLALASLEEPALADLVDPPDDLGLLFGVLREAAADVAFFARSFGPVGVCLAILAGNKETLVTVTVVFVIPDLVIKQLFVESLSLISLEFLDL